MKWSAPSRAIPARAAGKTGLPILACAHPAGLAWECPAFDPQWLIYLLENAGPQLYAV